VRLSIVLACLICSAARADLATSALARDDWGPPEIALTVDGEGLVSASFVLYESGRVLYRPTRSWPPQYALVTLTPDERRALTADLPLARVGSLHPPLVDGADGATYCIDVWSHGAHKRDCIWGSAERSPGWSEVPAEMDAIWKRLGHFSSARARPWTPESVTVQVLPWVCGGLHAVPALWPRSWPLPTVHADGLSFEAPAAVVPSLRQAVSTTLANGCVQPIAFDGQLVYVSYKLSLPHERAWMMP